MKDKGIQVTSLDRTQGLQSRPRISGAQIAVGEVRLGVSRIVRLGSERNPIDGERSR